MDDGDIGLQDLYRMQQDIYRMLSLTIADFDYDSDGGHTLYPISTSRTLYHIEEVNSETNSVWDFEMRTRTTERQLSDQRAFDPFEPMDDIRDWSGTKKFMISMIVSYCGFVTTLGASIYTAAIPITMNDMNVSRTQAIMPIICYYLGLAFGSFFWTAVTDLWGRRFHFSNTQLGAAFFCFLSGFCSGIPTLSINRFLAGAFSSSSIVTGGGHIGDIWNINNQWSGTIFAVIHALFLVAGTELGPMVGAAFINNGISWSWLFWFHTCLQCASWIFSRWVPETYFPKLLRDHHERVTFSRIWPSRDHLGDFGEPLKMFWRILFREPTVFMAGLTMGLAQTVILAYYSAYPALFQDIYGQSPYQVGMAWTPILVGSVIAFLVLLVFDTCFFRPSRISDYKWDRRIRSEDRLWFAVLGSIALPVSLCWLARTGGEPYQPIIPTISGGLFGFSYVLNLLSLALYNGDTFHPRYCGLMLGGLVFMQYFVSALLSIFVPVMMDQFGWEYTIWYLACLTGAVVPIPLVCWYFGERCRRYSEYIKPPPEPKWKCWELWVQQHPDYRTTHAHWVSRRLVRAQEQRAQEQRELEFEPQLDD